MAPYEAYHTTQDGAPDEHEIHIINIFEMTHQYLPAFHPRHLLDAGCGDGDHIIRIFRQFGMAAARILEVGSI